MKKYLFGLLLLCLAIYFFPRSAEIPRMKILSPSFERVSKLDTQKVEFAYQYELLRALFATLVIYGEDGKIKSGLAEEFGLDGCLAWFKIRKNIKTVDGYNITPLDVVNTFKRSIVLGKATHGRISSFLKPSNKFKKISDDHSSITYTDSTVTFNILKPDFFPFFIISLTSIDFGIIPTTSIDVSSRDLKIKEFRNTSGPYYLATEREGGWALFKANPGHYLLSKNGPSEIELVPGRSVNLIKMIRENNIDIVPTIYFIKPSDVQMLKELDEYSVHETLPIHVTFMDFTSEGYKKFNVKERLGIGVHFRNLFLKACNNLCIPTKEYFGIVGDGGLTQMQKNKLDYLYKKAEDEKIKGEVVLDVHRLNDEVVARISQIQKMYDLYDEVKKNKQPSDARVVRSDSASTDNVTLLEYAQSRNRFGYSDDEFDKWKMKYMSNEDVDGRQEMIRNLHFKMLSEGRVIPLSVAPYYAVARKPWRIRAPIIFAGTPVWMIHYEP